MLDSGGATVGGRHRGSAIHHTLTCKVAENEISHNNEGQRHNKINTLITKDTDLVYAGFDSHHDGVTKHFPIFRQSFPGLKF